MLEKAKKSSLSFVCGETFHFAHDFSFISQTKTPISYTVYSVSHTISCEALKPRIIEHHFSW